MVIARLTPVVRRALRVASDTTLAEVAAQVGVAEATVHYWEAAGAKPRKLEHRLAYEALLREWASRLTADLARAA